MAAARIKSTAASGTRKKVQQWRKKSAVDNVKHSHHDLAHFFKSSVSSLGNETPSFRANGKAIFLEPGMTTL